MLDETTPVFSAGDVYYVAGYVAERLVPDADAGYVSEVAAEAMEIALGEVEA